MHPTGKQCLTGPETLLGRFSHGLPFCRLKSRCYTTPGYQYPRCYYSYSISLGYWYNTPSEGCRIGSQAYRLVPPCFNRFYSSGPIKIACEALWVVPASVTVIWALPRSFPSLPRVPPGFPGIFPSYCFFFSSEFFLLPLKYPFLLRG